jgi:hypothetical protein
MKLEFEGKTDAIIAEMISLLSSLGFELRPREDEPPRRAAAPRTAEVEVEEVKRRGRPKKQEPVEEPKQAPKEAPATVADVQYAMEEDDVLNSAREDPDPTEELAGDPTYEEAALDTIALHKLKEDTLKQLRNLYISGKGPFVRQLLAKHGHGALVFPEVDAKYFPEIKADMERGVLN